MLYDIQTVVELFPGIRDHYAMPIGFLTAEEKRVARAQIPKWEALLPNLREQLVVANANANDARLEFEAERTYTKSVAAYKANNEVHAKESARNEVLREIDVLKRLVAKTEGVRRPSSTIQQHKEN